MEGVDVDAVAAAVRGCAGVSALDGGPFGETVTYLPGRTVNGVVIGGGRVRVQIRSRWGVEAPVLAASIITAVAPLTGPRPVDVVIADIDDPPSGPPARAGRRAPRATGPGGPSGPGPATGLNAGTSDLFRVWM